MSRLQRARLWWLTAQFDEKAAVVLLVLPALVALFIAIAAPAHPLPAPVR